MAGSVNHILSLWMICILKSIWGPLMVFMNETKWWVKYKSFNIVILTLQIQGSIGKKKFGNATVIAYTKFLIWLLVIKNTYK